MARSGARWLLLLPLLALELPAAAERSPGPAGERGAVRGLGCDGDAVRGSGCGGRARGRCVGVGVCVSVSLCVWVCVRAAGMRCWPGGTGRFVPRRLGYIRREGNAGTRRVIYLFISPRPVPAPHGSAERLGAGGRGRRASDT